MSVTAPTGAAVHALSKTPSSVKPLADRDDEKPAPVPHRHPKSLPNPMARAIIIGALLWMAGTMANGLFGERYTLTPTQNAGNNYAFRLDKLTGAVSFCSSQSCLPVSAQASAR